MTGAALRVTAPRQSPILSREREHFDVAILLVAFCSAARGLLTSHV